jgi:hypothetical protein
MSGSRLPFAQPQTPKPQCPSLKPDPRAARPHDLDGVSHGSDLHKRPDRAKKPRRPGHAAQISTERRRDPTAR